MRVFLLWIVCSLTLANTPVPVVPIPSLTGPAITSPIQAALPHSQANSHHNVFEIPTPISSFLETEGEQQRKRVVALSLACSPASQTQQRCDRLYPASNNFLPLIPFSVPRIFLPRSAPDEPLFLTLQS